MWYRIINMNEKETPQTKADTSGEIEDNFSTINKWQRDNTSWEEREAARIARERIFSDKPAEPVPPKEELTNHRKLAATFGIVAAVVGGSTATGIGVAEAVAPKTVIASSFSPILNGEGTTQATDRVLEQLAETDRNHLKPSEGKLGDVSADTREQLIHEASKILSDNNGNVHPGQDVYINVEQSTGPLKGISYEVITEDNLPAQGSAQVPLIQRIPNPTPTLDAPEQGDPTNQ